MIAGQLTATIGDAGGGLALAVRALAGALGGAARVYGEGANGFRVRGPGAVGYLPGLVERMRGDGVELAHVHGLWVYTSVAALRWGGPRVVSPHGMLDGWALRNSGWKKRVAGWLYEDRHLKGAACLHALCGAELEAMRGYGLRGAVAVVPNGVDLVELGRGGAAGGGEKVLLYLGRIHPKKGLAGLLGWWKKASPTGWRLVVAGWDQGGYEGELKAMGVGGVEFVGPAFGEVKERLFRGASAFVLPSYSEGLPVAVLEAWSYGLPVAMTRECNLPEGFEAGAAVEMRPEGEGLEGLLGMDEGALGAMGMRGRRLVGERFTWERVAGEMVGVYEWVLGRGPKPACVVH